MYIIIYRYEMVLGIIAKLIVFFFQELYGSHIRV